MAPVKYDELKIDHIVEFSKDSTIFVAARENGNTYLRIFLINESTGHIYTRNGRADSWEELIGSGRDTIIARIIAARNNQVPVYKVNGEGPH